MAEETKKCGIDWIDSIPVTWTQARVKNYFFSTKKIVGNNVDNYERLALTMNGVIKRSKEDDNGLQPEKFESYQILGRNELVFKLIDLQNVSTSRVGLSPFTGIVSPAYIILHDKENIMPRFAEYFFLTMWKLQIFNRLGGDGVRSNINSTELLNLPIVLPSLEEQSFIVAYLDKECKDIDSMISDARTNIEDYKLLKQSIITHAVTQGLDPNVEMKESGFDYLGAIPNAWNCVRLRFIGDCQNGISKGGEYFGNGFPFVSYSDVYKNDALYPPVKGLIQSTDKERKIYSVQKGDVFFTRTSETVDEIGFSSVCLESISDAVFAGFLIRFRPYDKTLLPEFARYYFRSNIHRLFFVKEMNLVIRASLSQDLLKSLPILIPPTDEQKSIADYLNKKCHDIDEIISEQQCLIDDLEAAKKSLIYECVTGKRRVS